MNATEQEPDLFSPRPLGKADAAGHSAAVVAGVVRVDTVWLEKLLLTAGCWMTARDIILTTKGKVIDREIREVASESKMIISGQKGYKHVAHATTAEVNHCRNWLMSQGKKMIRRGLAIQRYAHQVLGAGANDK